MLYLHEVILYLLSDLLGKGYIISHMRVGLQLSTQPVAFYSTTASDRQDEAVGEAGQGWDPNAFGLGPEGSRFLRV